MLSTLEYLPLAAGIMISPMPIIAMIVLCATGRAFGGGTAFLMGWFLSILGFMGFAVFFLHDFRQKNPENVSLIAIMLQIAIALFFFWVAWNNWINRPKMKIQIPPPHWIETFSKYSQPRLFWMGAAMDFANVKNLPIMVTAALAISKSAQSVNNGMLHALLFALVASLSIFMPWLAGVFGGERSKPVVEKARDWLYKYNNIIMAVLFFYMGITLLSAAITNIGIDFGSATS